MLPLEKGLEKSKCTTEVLARNGQLQPFPLMCVWLIETLWDYVFCSGFDDWILSCIPSWTYFHLIRNCPFADRMFLYKRTKCFLLWTCRCLLQCSLKASKPRGLNLVQEIVSAKTDSSDPWSKETLLTSNCNADIGDSQATSSSTSPALTGTLRPCPSYGHAGWSDPEQSAASASTRRRLRDGRRVVGACSGRHCRRDSSV